MSIVYANVRHTFCVVLVTVRKLFFGRYCSVSMHFEKQGIVCPPNLRKGLFTVGALENLDHNPSSTTSQDSFHGTAISVFQFPSVSNSGIGNGHIFFDPLSTGKCLLPDNYAHVPVVDCNVRTVNLPACSTSKKTN